MTKHFKSISKVSHEQRNSTRVTGKEDKAFYFIVYNVYLFSINNGARIGNNVIT